MKIDEKILKEIETCVRCGYCQAYCPTYQATRHEGYNARGRMQLAKAVMNGDDISDLFRTRINQCLLCGSCSEHCPPGVHIPEIAERLRCALNEKYGLTAVGERMRKNITESGNVNGDEQKNRLLWLANLSEKYNVKINAKAEYLYLPGCVSSLYPSSYAVVQSFVGLLCISGTDFTVLGENELCCGYPLFIGGMESEAKSVARENVKCVKELGIDKIVTTCPSCYYMWKHHYPELLGEETGLKVIHGVELLAELCENGKLHPRELNETVTYHDPCDLGRKSGIFEAPRKILTSIPGITFKEMRKNRVDAVCCGGGGNLESNDPVLSGKVSALRISQAAETGATTIVSCCQQCRRTLQSGARTTRTRIKVADITELLFKLCEE